MEKLALKKFYPMFILFWKGPNKIFKMKSKPVEKLSPNRISMSLLISYLQKIKKLKRKFNRSNWRKSLQCPSKKMKDNKMNSWSWWTYKPSRMLSNNGTKVSLSDNNEKFYLLKSNAIKAKWVKSISSWKKRKYKNGSKTKPTKSWRQRKISGKDIMKPKAS